MHYFPPAAVMTAAILLLAVPRPAHAVVPGLAAPLQALMALLPQILMFIAAGIAGLLSMRAWRARLSSLGKWAVSARGAACISLFILLAAILVTSKRLAVPNQAAASGSQITAKAQQWPAFRAGLLRTGSIGTQSGPSRPVMAWSFRDPGLRAADVSSSPAVVGNRVYVGAAQASVFASSGMVYCIDAVTGKRIWGRETEKQVFSSPAVVDGRVYIGEGLHVDADCKLYCLDAASGDVLWSVPTKSHVESSPYVADGKVYFGAGEDGVYCVDAATGKRVWHHPGVHVDLSPAVANGKVYVGTGYGRTRAMCLDAETGNQVWEYPTDVAVWGPPAVHQGRVYFGLGNGDFVKSSAKPRGSLVCLDAKTGALRWRFNARDAVLTAAAVSGTNVYFGSRDGSTYCLDAASGKLKWSWPTGAPIVSSPAIAAGRVYVGNGAGKVFCLSAVNGKPLWEYDLRKKAGRDAAVLSSPAVANGRLYVGCTKGHLICLGGA